MAAALVGLLRVQAPVSSLEELDVVRAKVKVESREEEQRGGADTNRNPVDRPGNNDHFVHQLPPVDRAKPKHGADGDGLADEEKGLDVEDRRVGDGQHEQVEEPCCAEEADEEAAPEFPRAVVPHRQCDDCHADRADVVEENEGPDGLLHARQGAVYAGNVSAGWRGGRLGGGGGED